MSQQSQTAKPGGLGALFTSTIGLKVLMAVTGAALVLFVVQHMFANLQIFAGREVYNEYAHFMQSLGKLLWVARLGLILIVVLHIWAAVHVARLNDEARQHRYHKPRKYQVTTPWARYMLFSGVVIFLFIVYHILHFTAGLADPAVFNHWEVLVAGHWMPTPDSFDPAAAVAAGAEIRHDAYEMFILGLQKPMVGLFYVVANIALAMHLAHACTSMFQTLGLSYGKYRPFVVLIGPAIGALLLVGNVLMPLAMMTGMVQVDTIGAVAPVSHGGH
ncbi:MAG: succinate dehydrogenase cytochrome b subunit [Myxococcales bacterium]|nr:succinate dehydrogenase cytochrome b subunit [Myxococcales bacterium]MCB9752482.1 succinate dehydrogenase cytochrome b subunit [Myxococcales bacterium]